MPCRALAGFCLFSALLNSSLLASDWRPINPEDLSLKKSKIDPDADAEALFRDVRLLNEASTFGYPHNVITEYIRLKIFTERGKDKYANVQIPYWGKSVISSVEGRTIEPNGTIVELKKDAIFEKTAEKRAGQRTKVISFAMPAVEPGSIIEYRWTNNVGEFISRYIPLEVQSEFPVDEVTFHIKPVSGTFVQWPTMRFMPFGCNPGEPKPEMGGFFMLTLHNVPAFHEEPWMPPALSAKQWILIYYEENTNSGRDKYWTSLGRQLYGEYSSKVKVNGAVKDIAREVIAGAASDDEKLDDLAAYCRKHLKDIHGDEISTEEREKVKKEHNTTADTLRLEEGTSMDINLAFAALAQGAGYEARLARISDRATFLFNPAFQSRFFLNAYDIAVNVNGKWKFYDVANRDVPPGVLRWQEQGVYALITGPKPEFVQTPLLTSKDTQLQRLGNLKLSSDGVLEGDIRQLYLGNEAVNWRERLSASNDAEREDALRDELKHRFGDFDLTAVKYTVPDDLKRPIGLTYHIVIRGYAQRTGKRLFVSPNYFEAGSTSRFTSALRTQPIYFEYPWSEVDSIDLQLPAGFELDHADAPGGVNFSPIGSFTVQISIDKSKRLLYRRQLTFGLDTLLLFDAKIYPTMKQVFDRIQQADNHLLTLKAEAPLSAAK
ncbi:MAG TPA: DUF3857 domain-containing protein [Bryobacteraceae bacterium]